MKQSKIILCFLLVVYVCGCKEKSEETVYEEAKSEIEIVTEEYSDVIEDSRKATVVEQQIDTEDAGTLNSKSKLEQADQIIFEAALKGDIDSVKAALENNIDCNSRHAERDSTLLMFASFDGHVELMELLIRYGCEINAQDNAGRSALMYCASGNNLEAVKVLLDAGSNVEITDKDENFTALMFAAAEGQTEIVSMLLENGANWEKVDTDGDTARDFAEKNGHTEVVKLIEEFEKRITEE